MLGVIGLAATFFLGVNGLAADDKDEKKPVAKTDNKSGIDLEALFKKLDKDGDGKLSLEEFKRLEEFYKPAPAQTGGKGKGKGGFAGGFDPEMLKKLMEQFGGQGGFDPEMLKKLMERFGKGGKGGKGGFDPERLKKLLEKFGGQGGFDFDQIKKLMEKFGGQGGFDPDQLKKLIEQFGGQGGFDPEQLRKLIEQFRGLPGGGDQPEPKRAEKKKREI
jgi:Ca2+-binding EF-hand superfamily protein